MTSYISYFIPADGDSEEHPNVFLIRKPQKEVKTSDVTASFPLPGTYHFRAKQPLAKAHSESLYIFIRSFYVCYSDFD